MTLMYGCVQQKNVNGICGVTRKPIMNPDGRENHIMNCLISARTKVGDRWVRVGGQSVSLGGEVYQY